MSEAAMSSIVERLRERIDDLARETVERYRAEIADYAASSGTLIEGEVLSVTRRCLEALLDDLEYGTPLAGEPLEEIRRSLARRVNQGVSLTAIQQACRLFGEHVWEAILACTSPDVPEEREAALRAAGVLIRQVNVIATAGAQAYLDAAEDVHNDRHIIRRDLLEAVLSGRADAPATVRDARLIGIDLAPQHIVVVARTLAADDGSRPQTLRRAATVLREHLRSDAGPALVGMREGEIVCLCPASSPADLDRVKDLAHRAATTLSELGVSVGISGWHPTPAGVPTAYAEAREAAEIAVRTGVRGRAVAFDDVLIDHVLRSSEHAERIIGDALGPLREYDERRNASLVETLRAYVDSNFNVTRTARALSIHTNSVIYRLDRIRLLTGRDPRKADDLLFLALSLRLDAEAVL